jgi:hypothetical protein
MAMIKQLIKNIKKMKNIYRSLLFVTLLSASITACDEDKTTFEPLSYPQDSFVNVDSDNINVLESSTIPIVIPVNYANTIAGATSDIVVDFEITSDNAVEGTHYTIQDNKSQLSFSKGTFTDTIVILPIDNAEEDGDKILNFSITSAPVTLGFPGPDANGTAITITLTDDDCGWSLTDLDGAPWTGQDNSTDGDGNFSTQVTTSYDGTKLLMEGLAYGWLTGSYWDEVVIDSEPLIVDIDPVSGVFTIAEQYLCDTTWNGAPQPTYSIVGSGQYFSCLKQMVINYDLIQGGGVLRSLTETIEF